LAFVVVLVTLARTALAAPVAYADPFVPYDAIVPGQSAMVLAQYSCSFVYTGHYTADETGYCQIHPEDGPIVMVTVTVRDGAVQRLSFIVQDILFGDLVQRWGRPDTLHKGGRFYVARWSEGVYATAQTYQWFTYQSNVHHVSLGFARERAM
jgi:hypothetical protein